MPGLPNLDTVLNGGAGGINLDSSAHAGMAQSGQSFGDYLGGSFTFAPVGNSSGNGVPVWVWVAGAALAVYMVVR